MTAIHWKIYHRVHALNSSVFFSLLAIFLFYHNGIISLHARDTVIVEHIDSIASKDVSCKWHGVADRYHNYKKNSLLIRYTPIITKNKAYSVLEVSI